MSQRSTNLRAAVNFSSRGRKSKVKVKCHGSGLAIWGHHNAYSYFPRRLLIISFLAFARLDWHTSRMKTIPACFAQHSCRAGNKLQCVSLSYHIHLQTLTNPALWCRWEQPSRRQLRQPLYHKATTYTHSAMCRHLAICIQYSDERCWRHRCMSINYLPVVDSRGGGHNSHIAVWSGMKPWRRSLDCLGLWWLVIVTDRRAGGWGGRVRQ